MWQNSFLLKLTLHRVEDESRGESCEDWSVVLECLDEWRECSFILTSSRLFGVMILLTNQFFHETIRHLSHSFSIVQRLVSFVHLGVRSIGGWHCSFGPGVVLQFCHVHSLFRISFKHCFTHFSEFSRENNTVIFRGECFPEPSVLLLAKCSIEWIVLLVSIFEWRALSQHHEGDHNCREQIMISTFTFLAK